MTAYFGAGGETAVASLSISPLLQKKIPKVLSFAALRLTNSHLAHSVR